MKTAKYGLVLSTLIGITAIGAASQTKAAPQRSPDEGISGMYSFEREGEFVQINVQERTPETDKTKPLAVTGFISRYGDSDSDRGAFLDHFITKGSLEDGKISFATKAIHGIYYEFTGKVVRGSAKARNEDGYYELRGTLTQNTIAPDKTIKAKSREITMKLLPYIDDGS